MTKASLKDVTPLYQRLGLEKTLTHAVTRYDRTQENKKGYNIYALAQYLVRTSEVFERVTSGENLDLVLSECFCGKLELYIREFLIKAGYECAPSRHPLTPR